MDLSWHAYALNSMIQFKTVCHTEKHKLGSRGFQKNSRPTRYINPTEADPGFRKVNLPQVYFSLLTSILESFGHKSILASTKMGRA